MRTLTDLEAAFTVLEREADQFASVAEPTTTPRLQPVDLADLVAGSTAGRRPRQTRARTGAVVLACAAAVVALAVAITTWRSPSDRGNSTGGAPTDAAHGYAHRTTALLTVDPALGMRVLEVSTDADETTVDLYSTHEHVQLNLLTRGADVTPGLEPVDVNGARGYYSDGTRPPVVEHSAAPGSSTAPPPAPTPPDTPFARTVIWQYGAGTWAFAVFQGSIPTKADLLRVARGITFGKPTPIRSALALRTAPVGMHLAYLDAKYHEAGDNPPYDLTGAPWFTIVDYAPDGISNMVQLEATPFNLRSHWRGGDRLEVNGHEAYWNPADHSLGLDMGNGRYLQISEAAGTWDAPLTMTRAEIVTIAEQASISTNPLNTNSWFDATIALP